MDIYIIIKMEVDNGIRMCEMCYNPIRSDMMRYKCLICKDINVCGICYEKRRRNKNYEHEPFHPHILLNQLGT